jgi:UDP-4-amino-4,6-dideoxy-N-acetyl-beta-L-altrosamine N-acetyltransferase
MLELVGISLNDADTLLRWRNDPEVARYLYSDHAIGMAEHRAWIERQMVSETSRYWTIRYEGVPMGLAGIYDKSPHNRRCHWMFYLGNPASRGKGIGTLVEFSILDHVFRTLNYQKLSCEVLTFNESVIALHKTYGFQQECLLRRHVLKAGQWCDVIGLAILDHEWEDRRPAMIARMGQRGFSLSDLGPIT